VRNECVLLKEKGIGVAMLSVDDKAKVNCGHKVALDAGVRARGGAGSGSLAVGDEQYRAADHDFNTDAKMTPKGCLAIDIPESVTEKWSQGQLFFTVGDSTLGSSEPVSHGIQQMEVIRMVYGDPSDDLDNKISVLVVESDGGADHNNEHLKVVVAHLIVFMELKLALLIAMRPAAGDSKFNPIERAFASANLALTNCAFSRDSMPEELENRLAQMKGGGMSSVRQLAAEDSEIGRRTEAAWEQAMKRPLTELANQLDKTMWTGRNAKRIVPPEKGAAGALYKKYQQVLGLQDVPLEKLTKLVAMKSKTFKVSLSNL